MTDLYQQGWIDGYSQAEAEVEALAKRVKIAEQTARAHQDSAWMGMMFASVCAVALLFSFAKHFVRFGEQLVAWGGR